jgi:hypothetical protein
MQAPRPSRPSDIGRALGRGPETACYESLALLPHSGRAGEGQQPRRHKRDANADRASSRDLRWLGGSGLGRLRSRANRRAQDATSPARVAEADGDGATVLGGDGAPCDAAAATSERDGETAGGPCAHPDCHVVPADDEAHRAARATRGARGHPDGLQAAREDPSLAARGAIDSDDVDVMAAVERKSAAVRREAWEPVVGACGQNALQPAARCVVEDDWARAGLLPARWANGRPLSGGRQLTAPGPTGRLSDRERDRGRTQSRC